MSTINIYGMGAALVDTEIEVSDETLQSLEVEKGLMTLVDQERQAMLIRAAQEHANIVKRSSGGSAANTIIAASYFGSKAYYSCKVANDTDGNLYLNDLDQAGVEFNKAVSVAKDATTTGKCLVFITPDAQRSMNTYLGVSETINDEQIDEKAVLRSKWTYIEGYLVTSATGKPAAIKLRELAQKNNVKTAFSLSDPAMAEFFCEGLKDMIGEQVDLIFCNEEEAMHFTGSKTLDDACEQLKNHAKTFAITLGDKGAKLYDGERYIKVDAHTVKAVDTNGAGDMFAGAFLHALSQGQTFAEAGKLASKASSVVVSQFGPRLRPEQHQEILSSL